MEAMNSETPETDAKVAAICDRHPLSATNTEWYLRFQELAEFASRLEIRNRRLVEALRSVISTWDGQSGRVFESMGEQNPRALAIDEAITRANVALADQQEEKTNPCHGKLPDPTPAQERCNHEKWQKMKPQPRNCLECGLLMWDAGD